MNENLDLVKILKNCPRNIELYCPMLGTVKLFNVSELEKVIDTRRGGLHWHFDAKGCYIAPQFPGWPEDNELSLFPSKDQRDWSKFNLPQDYQDGDIFILERKGAFTSWIFSRKKQENSKQLMAYITICFERKTDKDLGYYPEGPVAAKDYKSGELRKASFTEQLKFKNALIARGHFTTDNISLQPLKFKVGDKVYRKGSTKILTINKITSEKYIYDDGGIIRQDFALQDQHLYELAPCETQQYDIITIKPGRVYWFQVTEDIKKNEILLQHLLLKSQGKVQEGKRNRYNPGDLIYLQGDKMKICEYAKGSYYAIRIFGTEIKLTPKK